MLLVTRLVSSRNAREGSCRTVGCLPGLSSGRVLRMDFPGAEAAQLRARYPAASAKVGEKAPPARGAVPFPVDSRFEFCILPPVV